MNKTKPTVELVAFTPIKLVVDAARQCTDTVDKSESQYHCKLTDEDKGFVRDRILKSNGALEPAHESVLEHLSYCFVISDVSRAVLQEIARHRMSSPSVKSTRFALHKIKKMDFLELQTQLVKTGDPDVDELNIKTLKEVQRLKRMGKKNDVVKYALPDAFKTQLRWTINARSLRNLFALRTSNRALPEFQAIAWAMFDAIPEHHKFIFEDRLHVRNEQ